MIPQLDEFVLSIVRRANVDHIGNTDIFLYDLMGTPDVSGIIERKAYVSFLTPDVPPGQLVYLWINPGTLECRKSTNYKNIVSPVWELVTDYSSCWVDTVDTGGGGGGGSGTDPQFNGGNVVVPIILARSPVNPMEAVTKQYLDNAITSINSNLSNTVQNEVTIALSTTPKPMVSAVQSIVALKQLDVTNILDKTGIFVEDVGYEFFYDKQSAIADNNVTVVKPLVGDGRWIILQTVVDPGTF